MTKDEALKLARRMGKQELTEVSREALQIASIIACRDALDAQPVPRRWVGLTDEEILDCLGPEAVRIPPGWKKLFRDIEAKLREKNT